jgi:orotidine-5'-phosphate decarboxylase
LAVSGRERIVAALDVPDPATAAALSRRLAGHVGMLKVGLELFVGHGRAAIEAVKPASLPIFLDIKLHDIPNTVEGAARGAGALGVALVTVHASGGAAMIRAVRKGLETGANEARTAPPRILAVTILTSLGVDDLRAIGFSGSPAESALRLARLAMEAGADGVVCSPEEVAVLRRELGPGPLLVVPGIRPAGVAKHDQQRTGSARQALRDGASLLVVGRPIREAPDPASAADALARELELP